MANGEQGGASCRPARNSDWPDHRPGQSRGRDRTHHVDGGDLFRHSRVQVLWHNPGCDPAGEQPGYHLLNLIYFLGAWDVETNAWGTALVLMALVLGTNMLAIVVRNHYRKKISW